jgi:hypothetical protein
VRRSRNQKQQSKQEGREKREEQKAPFPTFPIFLFNPSEMIAACTHFQPWQGGYFPRLRSE